MCLKESPIFHMQNCVELNDFSKICSWWIPGELYMYMIGIICSFYLNTRHIPELIFFFSQNALVCLCKASIGLFTLSDHAPTNCVIELGEPVHHDWHWKINETLLKDPEYEKQVVQELDSFFVTNNTGEVTPFCLWETYTCVIRGTLISLGDNRRGSFWDFN